MLIDSVEVSGRDAATGVFNLNCIEVQSVDNPTGVLKRDGRHIGHWGVWSQRVLVPPPQRATSPGLTKGHTHTTISLHACSTPENPMRSFTEQRRPDIHFLDLLSHRTILLLLFFPTVACVVIGYTPRTACRFSVPLSLHLTDNLLSPLPSFYILDRASGASSSFVDFHHPQSTKTATGIQTINASAPPDSRPIDKRKSPVFRLATVS
ncbi:hypothetical protein B0H66DRAFT_194388 [Apodospora peruviana]|uniref:Uncharacterized protein n=1 Tax=Apodospora peruviana TaxID=516989 RepID=A0AAE0IBP5_9PEZI|nr:hypothetical protein B0H66DRAFT_194388 [Apodospora peruviana]